MALRSALSRLLRVRYATRYIWSGDTGNPGGAPANPIWQDNVTEAAVIAPSAFDEEPSEKQVAPPDTSLYAVTLTRGHSTLLHEPSVMRGCGSRSLFVC